MSFERLLESLCHRRKALLSLPEVCTDMSGGLEEIKTSFQVLWYRIVCEANLAYVFISNI